MFGCGKFSEERFLLFIDGKKDTEIEIHLKECRECLKEFVELNRINAETDVYKPEKIKKSILLKSTGDKISSFFTNFENKRLVSAGVMGGENKKDILIIEYSEFLIKISKNEKCFTVSILTKDKKPFNVELKKKGEEIPFFMKTNSRDEITISELKGEKYILMIDDEEIYLNLFEEEGYEN